MREVHRYDLTKPAVHTKVVRNEKNKRNTFGKSNLSGLPRNEDKTRWRG